MADDLVTALLARALRDLVLFVEHRPDAATADDDLKALEDFADVMHQVQVGSRPQLRALLGEEVYGMLGWGSRD